MRCRPRYQKFLSLLSRLAIARIIRHLTDSFLQIASGPLVGFVLLAAVARIAVQISNRRRLYLSDAFLIFACACLCTATGILYSLFDDLYLDYAVSVDPASVILPPDFLDKAVYSLKLLFTYQTLLWAVVFMVKFSFLSFFRPLVSRLARLKIWWTIVVVFTVLTFVFCAADVFIICPHFDLTSRMSLRFSYSCISLPTYFLY